MSVGGPSRRDRLREQTVREIKEAGRRLLVARGPGGIALRAIARDMGMTAPGLYRYYASLDELIEELIADYYDEVASAMESARDALPPGDIGGRLRAVCRAFRRWSVAHPAEFGLTLGAPPPGVSVAADGPAQEAGMRFGSVFQQLFVELWAQHGLPVPATPVEPRLHEQLGRYAAMAGVTWPPAAVHLFLTCWVRVYGTVAMEVFGQLRWALDDGEALFEAELGELGELLGLAEVDPPPAARSS